MRPWWLHFWEIFNKQKVLQVAKQSVPAAPWPVWVSLNVENLWSRHIILHNLRFHICFRQLQHCNKYRTTKFIVFLTLLSNVKLKKILQTCSQQQLQLQHQPFLLVKLLNNLLNQFFLHSLISNTIVLL